MVLELRDFVELFFEDIVSEDFSNWLVSCIEENEDGFIDFLEEGVLS